MRPQGLKPASSVAVDAALKRRSSTVLLGLSEILRDILGNILGNMDFHLIDGVIEIAAGIPEGAGGLSAALGVCGARKNRVVATLGSFPVVGPQSPGVVGLFAAQSGGIPGCAAVS